MTGREIIERQWQYQSRAVIVSLLVYIPSAILIFLVGPPPAWDYWGWIPLFIALCAAYHFYQVRCPWCQATVQPISRKIRIKHLKFCGHCGNKFDNPAPTDKAFHSSNAPSKDADDKDLF